MKIEIPEYIFREYDIRGTVETELSEQLAYLIGRAYAKLAVDAGEDNIVVGHDCRHTSPAYADAVCRGINDGGLSAVLIGECPTPLVYWSIYQENYGGGIMVTGSHNPADMNGFKICLGKDTLHGAQIQTIKGLVQEFNQDAKVSDTPGKKTTRQYLQAYQDFLVDHSKDHQGDRKLKIVVDAGNGVAGLVGPAVLRRLGHEVIELFCEPDGNFPNHHPDPTVPENLKDLQEKVLAEKADFGIGWDGDGDRIGVVDEQANVIYGDMLVLIYARAILREVPGATIVADVKCSEQLFNQVRAAGGNAVMWKTGHSLIKSKLKELGAELGGEMSGHIFFKHRFYGFDCANYCSCRLVEIVSQSDRPFSALLADLPQTFNTPEIRSECPEEKKFAIVEKAKEVFADYEFNDIDGLRIKFDEGGWGLIRASNTQPVLVMRFEADSEEKLQEYKKLVLNKVAEISASL